MNYSQNHDSYRNSVTNNKGSQHFQNQKKIDNYNMKNDKQTNNIQQKFDAQSRLNYMSTPFFPKQQYPNINDGKALRNDTTEQVHYTNRIVSDGETTGYYSQQPNISYDAYSNSMANQCIYSPLEFMPFLYQFPNAGTHSNYWSLSNYYSLPSLGLSPNLDPHQGLFMMTKSSDNPMNSNSNFSSAIANNVDNNFNPISAVTNSSTKSKISNSPQINQIMRKNPPYNKQNNSGNLTVEAPAPGLAWNPYDAHLLDDSFHQTFKNLNINDCYSENIVTQTSNTFDVKRLREIISAVSETKIRKRLIDTMQTINPLQFHLSKLTRARFFVIKSYSEDDLHRAIKYGVWCSTRSGNLKLDNAYRDLTQVSPNKDPGRLFLFFSVNGSGFFAGVAEMISFVSFDENCGFWSQNKWVGKLSIRWHYVKDVRNSHLRHIRSEANENKPVTNSRDAVEVTPFENGMEFLKVFHNAKHETSVFDDFEHYERREVDPSINGQ